MIFSAAPSYPSLSSNYPVFIATLSLYLSHLSLPFVSEFYMVTARPVSENTQKLMDWFLSPQGQQLVEDVGYVPVGPTLNGGNNA